MSIETDVLFFLKETGKEEDVINSLKDSNINLKLHWHTDRKSFSIHSGVIFEEFRNSDSLKQIRICLDCVPQKIFPVIIKTAFAYPDVSFYDTTTLTGNDIAFSDAVLKIEFEDFVPGDFRLKKNSMMK